MPNCSANGCSNSNIRNKELSWFHFPLKRPELKQWLHNCGQNGCTKYSVVCSAHFEESCFKDDIYHRLMGQDPSKRRRRRLLKQGAVPTIFSHRPQSSKPRTSVERAAKPKTRITKSKSNSKVKRKKVNELLLIFRI